MAAVSVKRSIGAPFPNCSKPLFQSEAKCEATDMKMIFHSHANKTHLYKKGFALSVVLKVRVFATQKWHILKSLRDSVRKKIKNVVRTNVEATLAKDRKIFR